MKLITYKNSFLLAFMCFLASCESVIEIDPPEYVEQLVVQGFGSTEKDILNVMVSKTSGIFDDKDLEELLINDATVTLIHQGVNYVLEATTSSQNQGMPYNYILEDGIVDLQSGESYRLEVEADGFPIAIGNCEVPEIVLPSDFIFEPDGPSEFEDEYSKVSMHLDDPQGIGNYYEFYLAEGVEFNNELYFNNIYTRSLDPVVEETYYSLQLKDETFDGDNKLLDLLLYKYYFENEPDIVDRLYVYWRTVSKDHYLYNRSFNQHRETADNPFASPVQVYSNVENGLGIFTIYNEDRIKIN